MSLTFAFDVYGTLIDTHGLVAQLSTHLGERAQAFSQLWRDKQLEYSFRRGLMAKYQPFSVCTHQALEYSCQAFKVNFSDNDRQALLEAYGSLPAFPDVESGVNLLHKHKLFAFSNGTPEAVEGLLRGANLREHFLDIISVDEIGTFKPNPQTYQHFIRRADAEIGESWLISSNPFDVIGAKSFGMKAAWIKRSEHVVFDPWGVEPDIVASDLVELAGHLS